MAPPNRADKPNLTTLLAGYHLVKTAVLRLVGSCVLEL